MGRKERESGEDYISYFSWECWDSRCAPSFPGMLKTFLPYVPHKFLFMHSRNSKLFLLAEMPHYLEIAQEYPGTVLLNSLPAALQGMTLFHNFSSEFCFHFLIYNLSKFIFLSMPAVLFSFMQHFCVVGMSPPLKIHRKVNSLTKQVST